MLLTCFLFSDAGGGGYGQNIGAGFTAERVPSMIGNYMYNVEMPNYPQPYGNDNPDMTNFDRWGHFSQVVWKNTKLVGCAVQYCPNGLANTGPGISPYFAVCNYSPPGMSPILLQPGPISLTSLQATFKERTVRLVLR
jgi:hypothetical protein